MLFFNYSFTKGLVYTYGLDYISQWQKEHVHQNESDSSLHSASDVSLTQLDYDNRWAAHENFSDTQDLSDSSRPSYWFDNGTDDVTDNWGDDSSKTEEENLQELLTNVDVEIIKILLGEDSKNQSFIEVFMDDSNQQIAITLHLELVEALNTFVFEAAGHIPDIDVAKLSMPLNFHEPVHGNIKPSFTEFMAAGVILTIAYFMAVGTTSIIFIIERNEGLLDRSFVAGVRPIEVMLAHLSTQMLVMLVQIALILIFMFGVFEIPCKGNMLWVVLLTILQGLCGLTFGLMVSVLVFDEVTANLISHGAFYPIIFLSGILWPIQAMPMPLRYFSYLLPQTYACDGIRAVLYKGLDITYPDVWIGYVVTIAWIFIQVAIWQIVLKLKK